MFSLFVVCRASSALVKNELYHQLPTTCPAVKQLPFSIMATNVDTYRAAQNNESLTTGGGGGGGSPSPPHEKDFSNGELDFISSMISTINAISGYHLDNNMGSDDALRKIRTTGSLSISPELFEKIYLSPQNKVSGELRKTFGNPTPL